MRHIHQRGTSAGNPAVLHRGMHMAPFTDAFVSSTWEASEQGSRRKRQNANQNGIPLRTEMKYTNPKESSRVSKLSNPPPNRRPVKAGLLFPSSQAKRSPPPAPAIEGRGGRAGKTQAHYRVTHDRSREMHTFIHHARGDTEYGTSKLPVILARLVQVQSAAIRSRHRARSIASTSRWHSCTSTSPESPTRPGGGNVPPPCAQAKKEQPRTKPR